MKVGLTTVAERLHNRVLNLRKMEHIVQGSLFERLYNDSDEDELKEVHEILAGDDHLKLRSWIENHKTIELDEQSIRSLRNTARRMGIQNWSRQTKPVLIANIQAAEKRYEEIGDVEMYGIRSEDDCRLPNET
jgi:hypothetical protein